MRRFEPGDTAGYGRRWTAAEPTWVGIVPIGYGDGWRRGLTNNCEVLIRGRRHPLVGTVSMDNMTVELGPETDVAPGDQVVLIGEQGDERILRRGGRAAARHDQLRGHLRDDAARAPRARAVTDAWIVGGACATPCSAAGRATWTSRSPATPSAPRAALAAEVGGPVFPLSEDFGAWRVIARARPRLRRLPAAGRDDRGRPRASATSPSTRWRRPARGRRADRPARRPRRPRGGLLRVLGAEAYERDPLRAAAAGAPGRRARPRARRGDRAADARRRAARHRGRPRAGLRRAAPAGRSPTACSTASRSPSGSACCEAVLPELTALRGVEQSQFHHLDVYDHTLEVLAQQIELERAWTSASAPTPPAPRRARRAAGRRADARPGAALRRAAARHRQAGDARRARRTAA